MATAIAEKTMGVVATSSNFQPTARALLHPAGEVPDVSASSATNGRDGSERIFPSSMPITSLSVLTSSAGLRVAVAQSC